MPYNERTSPSKRGGGTSTSADIDRSEKGAILSMRCIRSIVHYALEFESASVSSSLSLFHKFVGKWPAQWAEEAETTPPLFEAVYKFVWMQSTTADKPFRESEVKHSESGGHKT